MGIQRLSSPFELVLDPIPPHQQWVRVRNPDTPLVSIRNAQDRHPFKTSSVAVNVDIFSVKCSKELKLKFEVHRNAEDVLSACPHDVCCICYRSFKDILNGASQLEDLTVLPKCSHLICLNCMENCVSHAYKK